MSMNFRKFHQRKLTYIPSNITPKHKHNYVVHCVLEITNKSPRAAYNYYDTKEYHNVLKCDLCDSFIPLSEEGNFSGYINDQEYNKELPLIMACTNMKNPAYDFDSLYDVAIKEVSKDVKYEKHKSSKSNKSIKRSAKSYH